MAKAKISKFRLLSTGFSELMQSEDAQRNLAERAGAIAAAAGGEPDFEVSVTKNRDRSVAFVRTANEAGRKAEAEDRALTRAIDAGR